MLDRIGVVTNGIVLHADGALKRIDLVAGEGDVVIAHIRPYSGCRITVGVCDIRHDIGEGFLGVLVQSDLIECGPVLTDFPDPQIGGTIHRMLGCGNELQVSVMIEVSDGIIPLHHVFALFQLIDAGIDHTQLSISIRCRGHCRQVCRLNGCFLCGGLWQTGRCNCHKHDQRKKDGEYRFCFHSFPHFMLYGLSAVIVDFADRRHPAPAGEFSALYPLSSAAYR